MANNKLSKIREEYARKKKELGNVELLNSLKSDGIQFNNRFRGIYLAYGVHVHIGLKSEEWFKKTYCVKIDQDFRNRALSEFAKIGYIGVEKAAQIATVCQFVFSEDYSSPENQWSTIFSSLLGVTTKGLFVSNASTALVSYKITEEFSYVLTYAEYETFVSQHKRGPLTFSEARMARRALAILEFKGMAS